jgi:hypothetical protein
VNHEGFKFRHDFNTSIYSASLHIVLDAGNRVKSFKTYNSSIDSHNHKSTQSSILRQFEMLTSVFAEALIANFRANPNISRS